MLDTPDNRKVFSALLGVARAHTHLPLIERSSVMAIVEKVDTLVKPHRRAEVLVALCILLLRGLGLPGADQRVGLH